MDFVATLIVVVFFGGIAWLIKWERDRQNKHAQQLVDMLVAKNSLQNTQFVGYGELEIDHRETKGIFFVAEHALQFYNTTGGEAAFSSMLEDIDVLRYDAADKEFDFIHGTARFEVESVRYIDKLLPQGSVQRPRTKKNATHELYELIANNG